MEFKNYTYNQLKDIAEIFLTKNKFRKGELPTNIEILIEKSGIIIEAIFGLRKEFSVKGLVAKEVKNDSKLRIIIDSKHYEEDEFEYKFTLAEELAHILLHYDFYHDVKSIDDFIGVYKSIDENEYRKYESRLEI